MYKKRNIELVVTVYKAKSIYNNLTVNWAQSVWINEIAGGPGQWFGPVSFRRVVRKSNMSGRRDAIG